MTLVLALVLATADEPLVPRIDGDPWVVARDPDLGALSDPKQQPVDFAVWQAADGTWQLWSCIRGTKCGGKTRLFHRWEGATLTATDWKPMGVAMEADPKLGETAGGLQAPHVVRVGDKFEMFYGDWERICRATSADGKTFTRAGPLYTEAPGGNTRDPMLISIDGTWHCFTTAHPGGKGAVYSRRSKDLATWTDPKIVAQGGAAGDGPYTAECPFVVERKGFFYLFRTQRYGEKAQTTVYRSKDPRDFGLGDDRCRVGTLPIAAPEIVTLDGRDFVAFLLPSLKGIQLARLAWDVSK